MTNQTEVTQGGGVVLSLRETEALRRVLDCYSTNPPDVSVDLRILRAALERGPEDVDPLMATNRRRSLQAAATSAAQARQALEDLGTRLPPQLAETARLRVEHPEASLVELGRLSSPRLTKDQVAGRLRRLLDMAGRA